MVSELQPAPSFRWCYDVQFHGLVGQGHEARVVMMLNDDVVATMYDKDYSGNNNRYAMFGQSVILDMKGL